jgi:small subunit ribosomal protein S20
MPITDSAKKALRQNIKRRAINVAKKKDLKEAIKNYKKSPSAELLSLVYQKLDKAAKTNLLKKNTASRLKSRLTKLLRTPASRS